MTVKVTRANSDSNSISAKVHSVYWDIHSSHLCNFHKSCGYQVFWHWTSLAQPVSQVLIAAIQSTILASCCPDNILMLFGLFFIERNLPLVNTLNGKHLLTFFFLCSQLKHEAIGSSLLFGKGILLLLMLFLPFCFFALANRTKLSPLPFLFLKYENQAVWIRSHLLAFAEMKIQLTFTCLIATREGCRSTVGSSQVLVWYLCSVVTLSRVKRKVITHSCSCLKCPHLGVI